MAKKCKVVKVKAKVKVTVPKPTRMSRGCEFPHRLYALHILSGCYEEVDAYYTEAAAWKAAAGMPFGTYPVIVHIDIPPMPY